MWLEILLFLLVLGLLFYLDTKKPDNFPPGPAWLPIIGSLPTILRLRKKTGYLYKAACELKAKYGPVVGLRIGKDKIVMVFSPETIREVDTVEELQGRPTGPFYETRTWGIRRGVLLTDERFWQEQRRFTLRHLREFGYAKGDMTALVEDESQQLVKNVLKLAKESPSGSATIQAHEFFGIYIINALWSMLAGKRYNHGDPELQHLQKILALLFSNIDMVGAPFSQFPILRYLAPDMSGYKFFVDIHKQFWRFLNEELKKHKEVYNPGDLRDFMDVYLSQLEGPEKSDSFDEPQLIAICLDMFIAGSETTSKTLAFAILYMVRQPEVVARAHEELDRVIGKNRMVSLADKDSLPYMKGIVLESVRMFIMRAFSVPHRALKDSTIGGYFIPKDTMILPNYFHVLTDGYEDPMLFKPERYIKADGKVEEPQHYYPFGFGKRRCIGEALARANLFMILASLLQRFNIELPPGAKMPTTDGVDGATPGTVPFEVRLTPRDGFDV